MTKTINLEGAIRRLEEISAQLNGDISIEESIKLYTEAVKLIETANTKLDAAKLKVEKLSAAKEQKDESV